MLGRGRASAADIPRATRLGGHLSYYLGRLVFASGYYPESRRFCQLGNRYATQVGDATLAGSIAALESSIAYYGRRWREAATVAARARSTAPSYLRGRLAAYEARAWAMLGEPEHTAAALSEMWNRKPSGATRPGSSPFTTGSAHMFDAVCALALGDAVGGGRHASEAVDSLDQAEERSHALLCLAEAYVVQDQPDPGAAVEACRRALAPFPDSLTSSVVLATDDVCKRLEPWVRDNDVRALVELVGGVRASLPAGSTA